MNFIKGAQFYLTLFFAFVTIFCETSILDKLICCGLFIVNAFIVRYWYRSCGESEFLKYTGISWLERVTGIDFHNE